MTIMAERPTEVEVTRSEMKILDHTGDTTITWDPTRPDEVAAARAAFKKAKEGNYLAYKLEPGGGRGEVLREFDPAARSIVMTRRCV